MTEKFTPRELTVGEVHSYFEGLESDGPHFMDLALPERMPHDLICTACNVKPGALDALLQSEYEALLDRAEKVNPIFMAGHRRLVTVGQAIQVEQQKT